MKGYCVPRALLLLTISAAMLAGQAGAQKRREAKAPAARDANAARIREVRSKLSASTVPQECLVFVRQFIDYLSQGGNDLTTDTKSREKWLAETLDERLTIAAELCRKTNELHPDDALPCPDNGFFIVADAFPVTYSIIGSRRYGDSVLVDLQLEWPRDKDYPDDKLLQSYLLLHENGRWKLCDIYTFGGEVRGDIMTGSSLNEGLEKFANYLALSARIPSPYIDQQLAGTITLTPQWLELTPKEPLRVERDTQEVTLFPDPPIKMVDDPTGRRSLIAADRRDAVIEAELIDSKGVTHRARPGVSETMTGDLRVTSRSLSFKDLPKDVTYTKVRIKSSASYPVRKILWRCYNWSEVNN